MVSNRPAVVVHVVNALEGGGTEQTLVALLRAFDPARLRHIVVTLRHAGSLAGSLPDHVACRPIGAKGRCRTAGLTLAKWLRSWRAEIVHARNTGCWNDTLLASAAAPRARVVLGFHGLEHGGPFNVKARRSARWGMLAGARFAGVSRSGCQQLGREARIPRERIDYLPNGVDREVFRATGELRSATRRTLGLDAGAFVVGIVGSLTPVKRHSTLIAAAAVAARTVENLEVLIVGDGPLRADLVGQADNAGFGSKVHWLGRRSDIPALLAAMDAYVCSSESEGMSNSVLQAMAMGLPTVATNVGDNGRMIRDGVDGIIIEPDAEAALASALRSLADDSELRGRLGWAARERTKDFAFDRTVARYQEYYEGVVSRSRRQLRHAAVSLPAV